MTELRMEELPIPSDRPWWLQQAMKARDIMFGATPEEQLMNAFGPTPLLLGPMKVAFPQLLERLLGTKVVGKSGSPRRLYHGTSAVFERPSEGLFKKGLYGPGHYMTENPKVASGYAGKYYPELWGTTGRTYLPDEVVPHGPVKTGLGPTGYEVPRPKVPARQPNVHPSFANIRNPFDIDRVADPALVTKINEITTTRWGQEPLGPKVKNKEVYQLLLRMFDDKGSVNDWLQANGYDGITHMAGESTGKRHRVWIAFTAEQVVPAFGGK